MFKFKLKSKQNKAPDKIKLLQNFNNIQTLDDLPVKNYNELNVYSNTNIGDNDTFPIWNSFISSMERITWLEYKNNLKIQILPNYSITINSTNYFFDEDNNIDITSEFTSYLKKNGSILLDGSYLPTDPNSIVPKKYVDSRTAYSFIYKTTQTIGDYLDILPTKDYVDNIVDGYATEVYVDTKLDDYINKNGATAFTGSANFGGYEVINMGAPTSTNSGATKGYVDLKAAKSTLIEIPISAITVNSGVSSNLTLGSPTLKFGSGVVGDYVTVVSNTIKIVKTDKLLDFSGIILGTFSGMLSGNANLNFYIRRPATVTAPGTTANDIVHTYTRVKLAAETLGDFEFTFKKSFASTASDPFVLDGFVLNLQNQTSANFSLVTTKTGVAVISSLRIEFSD